MIVERPRKNNLNKTIRKPNLITGFSFIYFFLFLSAADWRINIAFLTQILYQDFTGNTTQSDQFRSSVGICDVIKMECRFPLVGKLPLI